MEYFTCGKEHFPGVSLPLAYSASADIPEPSDGYCAIVCSGRGLLRLDDGSCSRYLRSPVAVFVRPGHTLRKITAASSDVHSCIFRPDAVNTTAPVSGSGYVESGIPDYFFFRPFAATGESGFAANELPAGVYAAVSRLCASLDEALNRAQGPFWPCLSRSYFLELLILLERHGYLADPGRVVPLTAESASIDPALEFIHARYAEPITLDGLASMLATNRTTLNRRFNAACGMSAMAYLYSVRIEVASALLRNTELSVAEIAGRTGFSDESYFSRSFRKANGVSPAAYRKSYPDPYSPRA